MCWTSKNVEKEIASEDIKVFKIVTNEGISYFEGFPYTLNKQYKIDKINIREKKNCFSVQKGFHSYSKDCKILEKRHPYGFKIGKCCVFYNHLPLCSYINSKIIKMECIIPKDSEYYLNDRGEYVSNSIIPIKYINLWQE